MSAFLRTTERRISLTSDLSDTLIHKSTEEVEGNLFVKFKQIPPPHLKQAATAQGFLFL